MTSLRFRLAATVLLLAVASTGSAGDIKKWVDANGNVSYGDRAPASVTATSFKLRKSSLVVPEGKRKDMSPQAQLERLLASRKGVTTTTDPKEVAEKCGAGSDSTCVTLVGTTPKDPGQTAGKAGDT